MTIDRAADAAAVFAAEDLTEAIQFRARPSDDPRTIQAVLKREPLDTEGRQDPGPPFAGVRPPLMLAIVQNHATDGVTPDEVVDRSSELLMAYPLGATDEASGLRWRKINRIVSQNPGQVMLEVMT